MAQLYDTEDVLSMLDIPLPEDDDYSGDEFDGYLSEGDENDDGYSGERGGSGDEDEDMGEEDDNTSIPSYAGTPGCTQDMSNKSPLEFLELLITDEMLMTIQQQTILYAEQYISSNTISRRSRVKQWHRPPHTISEVRKFLAMVIVMRLVNLPRVEDYWVTSWPFASPALSK